MKKFNFITGICVGIALSACSVAVASSNVAADLFPSKIHFLVNGTLKNMDGSGENAIINYNNKAYIPLRSFAESMGAAVDYRYASIETGNKHIIDIYTGTSKEDFTVHDPNGYVSLTPIKVGQSKQQQTSTEIAISGLLRVDKDLGGKKIQINALNREGNVIGSTVANRNNDITLGDIVNLNTSIIIRGDLASFQVQVKDTWGLTTRDYFVDNLLLDEAGLVFGKGHIDPNQGLVQTLSFKNQNKQDINLEPLEIEYHISKVSDGEEELVYSCNLAPLEGIVPEYGWYEANIPVWNLRDQDGNPVSPGKYIAKIVLPNSVNYTMGENSTTKTLKDQYLSRFTQWEYDMTQSEIDQITK